MMGSNLVFVIAVSLLVCGNVSRVQSADKCKTHADCLHRYRRIFLFCCGGLYFNWGDEHNKDRSCWSSSCLGRYCSKDSDCGDPSMCCRSNECVNKGCLGCTNNTDCDNSHVCCKKTFTFNQTLCAAHCINQDCNWNDDCAGTNECCRSGKCTTTGCWDKCESNSDCDFGQYCCRKKSGTFWMRRNAACAKSCVGEICSTGEDCGPPNECCISNKCVTSGCSGCTTNTNCSSGHYCCKKRQWYELSECSADCIGKSCSTTEDCGGPGETCGSDNRCAIDRRKIGCTTSLNCSSGHYCCKKRQWYELSECSADCIGKSCSTTEDCGGPGETCGLGNRCAIVQNRQSKTECSDSTPSWLIAVITVTIAFFVVIGIILAVFWYIKRKPAANTAQAENQLLQTNGAQNAPSRERNENQQFYVNYRPNGDNQGHCQPNNPLNNPMYHSQESPYPAQDAQYHEYQNSDDIQIYPQSTPYQATANPHNPPYNPHFHGNH